MKLIFICIALTINIAVAETLTSVIYSVERLPNEKTSIIKLTNGRVALIRNSHPAKLAVEHFVGSAVMAEVDSRNSLLSLNVLKNFEPSQPIPSIPQDKLFPISRPPYYASVIEGYNASVALFKRMNPNFNRNSECSDRAHVWANDEFIKNGIKTNKIFIFFTASYINRTGFKWWFHVAPLLSVNEDGKVNQRVLDYMYSDRPLLIKEWSDRLVFSKRECKQTEKFSEYDVNPQTEDCYIIIDSMYYQFPGELYDQEKTGTYKTKYIDVEVIGARKRAFRTGEL